MHNTDESSPRAVWAGLSQYARRRVIVQAVVHASLVVLAFRSLSKQEAKDLRGPELLWKSVIPASTVNLQPGRAWVIPVGPLLYFAFGKRRRPAVD